VLLIDRLKVHIDQKNLDGEHQHIVNPIGYVCITICQNYGKLPHDLQRVLFD
jgi:hypothetical protein